ncbi:hypothetical protein NDU88_002191 [Pleurodeles waltl]|uniref:Uncharacterized protein n=1 Tax=Pleurodeles waltl TaxID=8319 RepID=A0AAV7NEQ7_PLEWA|nr:hypothetical protein NDU88_002191 [Pleurodeles waltl]
MPNCERRVCPESRAKIWERPVGEARPGGSRKRAGRSGAQAACREWRPWHGRDGPSNNCDPRGGCVAVADLILGDWLVPWGAAVGLENGGRAGAGERHLEDRRTPCSGGAQVSGVGSWAGTCGLGGPRPSCCLGA